MGNSDAGSWKFIYEVNEKDPKPSALIKADLKINPNKIVVTGEGGIPDMDREQLAQVGLLLSNKVDAINNTPASEVGSHVASLRMIATFCNEMADFLTVGEIVEGE